MIDAHVSECVPGKKSGRRPKLTRDMILEAAIEIGLDTFSVTDLASRLGTGMSAIYRVLPTRNDIVQQAAQLLMSQFEPPKDTGQTWSEYLLEYAAFLFAVLTENRLRAIHFLEGGLGPRVQLESGQDVLALLISRGFSAKETVITVKGVVHLVGGAAMTQIHLEAAHEQGRSHTEETLQFLEGAVSKLTPAMRAVVEVYADETMHTDWLAPVKAYLRGIALQRGEQIGF